MQRTPGLAGELIPVGKETDRKWDDGEDISILDRSMIHYTPKKVKADAETIQGFQRFHFANRCATQDMPHEFQYFSLHFSRLDMIATILF